jgi:hypothetical protein
LGVLGARPRLETFATPPQFLAGPDRQTAVQPEPAAPLEAPQASLSNVVAFAPPTGEDLGVDELDELLDDEDEAEEGDFDDFVAPVVPDEVLEAQLREARADAQAQALAGPHRVLLSTPAGPGSIPEALKVLEEAGRVRSDFVEDEELGPHLLYVPVGAG